MHEVAKDANKLQPGMAAALRSFGTALGVLQQDPDAWLQGARIVSLAGSMSGHSEFSGNLTVIYGRERIERLIARRSAARQERNFAEADGIRAELLDQGVILEDGADGTTWRRA
jgi:cysteinyl-tRNA synthetase